MPMLVAAAGPRAARFAGRVGDGFITTSGKPAELYTETLLPAVAEGIAKAGRDPDALRAHARGEGLLRGRRRDGDRATAATGRRSPCPPTPSRAWTTRSSWSGWPTTEHVQPESRFIVSADPDEVCERIGAYVELGLPPPRRPRRPAPIRPASSAASPPTCMPRLRARFS